VLNKPELNTVTVISMDGTITFPYVGSLYIKGLKLSEIEKKIIEKLTKEYINYPDVSVSLVTALSKKYIVSGEVRAPGEFPFEEGTTVEKALLRAGDRTEIGRYGKIKLKRKQGKSGYKEIEIDMDRPFMKDSVTGDLVMQPDDILTVERKTYFVYGAVAKTGEFPLDDNMTLLRAISLSGGMTQDGLYNKIKLRRKQEADSDYKDIEVDLRGATEIGGANDILLQSGDILFVDISETFFVQGEVPKPGKYPLQKETTIGKTILNAGGITSNGSYGKLKLRRKQKDSREYIDAAESGINKGKIDDAGVENMFLQPDDILIVELNQTYFVYGEFSKPGEYILKEEMTVFKAVILAGGFTKWGSPTRIKILREKKDKDKSEIEIIKVNIDAVMNGDATADILLKPGDVIIASTGIF
jgi:polysaccharide export outer membrane protein